MSEEYAGLADFDIFGNEHIDYRAMLHDSCEAWPDRLRLVSLRDGFYRRKTVITLNGLSINDVPPATLRRAYHALTGKKSGNKQSMVKVISDWLTFKAGLA